MTLLLGFALATTVTADQTVFPVHAKVSVRVRVEAGPEGLNPGDVLTVDEPVFHGMRWAKWGYLQTDPERSLFLIFLYLFIILSDLHNEMCLSKVV